MMNNLHDRENWPEVDVGVGVEIVGLKNCSQYNGLSAVVISIDDALNKVVVRLENSEKLLQLKREAVTVQKKHTRGKGGILQEPAIAFLRAVREGELEKLQTLLKNGADPNTRSAEGRTALCYAAETGSDIIVYELLCAKANIDDQDESGDTALALAIKSLKHRKENRSIVESLLRANANPNIKNKVQKNALDYAEAEDKMRILQLSLGFTPLMSAAHLGDTATILNFAGRGVDINERTVDGRTALLIAAGMGHMDGVRVLIEAGSILSEEDLNHRNGQKLLELAVRSGNLEMVKLVMSTDAYRCSTDKVSLVTSDGKGVEIARNLACQSEFIRGILENDPQNVRITLSESSCSFNSLCLISEYLKAVSELEKCGEKQLLEEYNRHFKLYLETKDIALGIVRAANFLDIQSVLDVVSKVPNILHLASQKNCLVSVRSLIQEHKLDPTVTDSNGNTALHFAGGEEIVDTLIEARADALCRNKDGKTPLHVAAAVGNTGAARSLVNLFATAAGFGNLAEVAEVAKLIQSPTYIGKSKHALPAPNALGMIEVKLQDGSGKVITVKRETLYTPLNMTDACQQNAVHFAAKNGHVEILQMLVKIGADFNAKDHSGATPLSIAKCEGCQDLLKQAGADGWTLLMVAAEQGDLERVQRLIGFKADVSAQNKNGKSVLDVAKSDACRLLLKSQGADQWTPLMIAAEQNNCQEVKALVYRGENVASKNRFGRTAMFYTSTNECRHELQKGELPSGWTPIMMAAKQGDLARLKILVESKNICVNHRDGHGKAALDYALNPAVKDLLKRAGANGWTPLMVAAEQDDLREIRALLETAQSLGKDEMTAYINAVNIHGKNALYYATEPECKNTLRCAGVDGWTHLMVAAQQGDVKRIQLLLSQGLPVTPKNKYGKTAMDYAKTGKIKAALKHENSEGWTELMLAAQQGDLKRVTSLIEWGVNVHAVDLRNGKAAIDLAANDECRNALKHAGADGWTALMIAAEQGDLEQVQELLKNGADPREKNKYGKRADFYASTEDCKNALSRAISHSARRK